MTYEQRPLHTSDGHAHAAPADLDPDSMPERSAAIGMVLKSETIERYAHSGVDLARSLTPADARPSPRPPSMPFQCHRAPHAAAVYWAGAPPGPSAVFGSASSGLSSPDFP